MKKILIGLAVLASLSFANDIEYITVNGKKCIKNSSKECFQMPTFEEIQKEKKVKCNKYLEKADYALSYIGKYILTEEIIEKNKDFLSDKKDGTQIAIIANSYMKRYEICIKNND